MVLMVSFLFTNAPKQEQVNYKKIVEERKIAYSLQRNQIHSNINFNEQSKPSSNFQNKITGEVTSYYKNNKIPKPAEAKEYLNNIASAKRNVDFMNKPRYTILNETIVTDPERGNKEVQIFYPINFQRSA